MATAHRRYNTSDRFVVRGTETVEIKMAKAEFYAKLYSESESWRPSFDYSGCSKIHQIEQ